MLNGTKEEVEKLREKMEERRTKAKTKVSFNLNKLQLIYDDDVMEWVVRVK